MLPPDSTLSDEPQSLNYPLAASAEIVIRASTDQNDHLDYYHGSAQDQPSSKGTKTDQQSARLKHPQKWRIEQDLESYQPKQPRKHSDTQKTWSPVECFELFLVMSI